MRSILPRLAAVIVSLALAASAHASTYIVTSLADPGDGVCDDTCTFRDAILAANASAGQDRIDFGAVTAAAPVSIYLSRGLPAVTDSVIMDASIQETRDLPGSPDRRPGIVLDLSGATPVISPLGLPFFANGLSIFGPGASDTLVRGFVINGIEPGVSQFCAVPLLNPNPQNPGEPDVTGCSNAVLIFAADRVQVAGNYLNMDADGAALAGRGIKGIAIVDASDNMIGGEAANDRNVMTAKDFAPGDDNGEHTMITLLSLGWGAEAYGTPKTMNGNRIVGNYLGLGAAGEALNPVARGVWTRSWNIPDSPEVGQIGWGEGCNDPADPCEVDGNLYQGNTLTSQGGHGTFVFSGGQRNTTLTDNTTYSTAAVFAGVGKIEIFEDSFTGHPTDMLISNNRFGVSPDGTPSTTLSSRPLTVSHGERIRIENNVITGGFFDGVYIFDLSNVGIPASVNVTLSRNSIFGNCVSGNPLCQGVDLTDPVLVLQQPTTGPTPNDYRDVDGGANHGQNKPVLHAARSANGNGASRIDASLDSAPNAVYRVEFFSNSALNPAGRAEGERFLGQKTVSTNFDGHVGFSFEFTEQANGELANTNGISYITATATRKHCETADPDCLYGSTSEFSQSCRVDMNEPAVVACEN